MPLARDSCHRNRIPPQVKRERLTGARPTRGRGLPVHGRKPVRDPVRIASGGYTTPRTLEALLRVQIARRGVGE